MQKKKICPDCGGIKDFYFETCGKCSEISWQERFMSQVEITEGCWLWMGAKLKPGYGVFGIRYKNYKAHRISFELFNGPIGQGMLICHSCDNPPCVNPDHLTEGTSKDNSSDAAQKGLYKKLNGSENPMCKLTELHVRKIRDLSKVLSRTQLANRFGVSIGQIRKIILRERWSWLK